MRIFADHYQVDLPLKSVGAKVGKNHPKRSDFKFFAIFWSSSQKKYYLSDFYLFLELFEPFEALFLQKIQKSKIHYFFSFFFSKMAVNL